LGGGGGGGGGGAIATGGGGATAAGGGGATTGGVDTAAPKLEIVLFHSAELSEINSRSGDESAILIVTQPPTREMISAESMRTRPEASLRETV
jgi:hypothetical protein